MRMMFGGWAREEEDRTPEDKKYSEGYTLGLKNGFNNGIQRAQLLITKDKQLPQVEKIRLWEELEKLKRK